MGGMKRKVLQFFAINANGKIAPKLVVYPSQRFPASSRLKFPKDWSMARSESGWMKGEIFYEYFAKYFLKWLKQQPEIKFPIVMFLDGHKSPLTYHLSLLCSQNEIILFAIPPNTTHVMQPLDVAVFHPVKDCWAETVHSWRMTKLLVEEEMLNKFNFAPLLQGVFDKSMKQATIVNGFKNCGLSPFNPDAVDFIKLDITKRPKSSQEAQTSISKPNNHNNHSCLNFMEAFIEKYTLDQFEDTYKKFTRLWQNDVKSQDFNVVWKELKDHISKPTNPQIQDPNLCTQLKTSANHSQAHQILDENTHKEF